MAPPEKLTKYWQKFPLYLRLRIAARIWADGIRPTPNVIRWGTSQALLLLILIIALDEMIRRHPGLMIIIWSVSIILSAILYPHIRREPGAGNGGPPWSNNRSTDLENRSFTSRRRSSSASYSVVSAVVCYMQSPMQQWKPGSSPPYPNASRRIAVYQAGEKRSTIRRTAPQTGGRTDQPKHDP